MKQIGIAIRIMLPIAAIVLLSLSLAGRGGDAMLPLGLLCSSLGIWMNTLAQKREKQNRE